MSMRIAVTLPSTCSYPRAASAPSPSVYDAVSRWTLGLAASRPSDANEGDPMHRILALDQGTTSTRSIVFDAEGNRVAQAQIPLEQIFPRPGWVEHDAMRIWDDQVATAREALGQAGVAAEDVAAVGVTNQRETVVVWDRATGVPIHNAIVWQDRRTADVCRTLQEAGHDPMLRERTGLGIDPYFSATKIAWTLDDVEGTRERAERGELAAGTIDSWLAYKLSGGAIHATDVTNASRTQLLDISTGRWDPELCELFRVPEAVLPEVVPSSGVVGPTDPDVLGAAIPIGGICGDQQAALAGNGCFSRGDAKATFGTGVFVLEHTGTERKTSEKLAVTIAAQIGPELEYALEGSIFMGGAAVQWLVEGLKLADSPQALQELAESVEDSGGVVLVPALTGLGAPHWDPLARGAILGLTRGSTDAHVARAGVEAIALQVGDVGDVLAEDSGVRLSSIRVDGGVTVNELVMQTLADVLGIRVQRALVAESTALGAAFLAGLAVGVWDAPSDLPALTGVNSTFEPDPDARQRVALMVELWERAVPRSKCWVLG
jgi:glycerol kinase